MSINILNIETSAEACSVALAIDGICVSSTQSEGQWRHSKEITLLIDRCLKAKDLDIKSLHAIAISSGPGSYTGLRVAASAAKGICFALDIPLIAVETLKAIAFPFKDKIGELGRIVPMIDARRDEVYYNIYNQNLEGQIETTNLILESNSFEAFDKFDLIFCGNGATKAEKILDLNQKFYPSDALAKHMSTLSYDKFNAELYENLAYYSPFYLKPPNITRSKKQLF